MTVGEMLHRVSPAEYRNWQRFSLFEPFPAERVDLAGALIATILANKDRRRGTPAVPIDDFLIIRQGLEEAETRALMASATNDDEREDLALQMIMAKYGGRPR
jgi:hypothetical protein